MTDTYPKYDGSADASTWVHGLNTGSGGTYEGFGGTSAGWFARTVPLNLQPGTYYITQAKFLGGLTGESDIGDARIAVFELTGGNLVPVSFDDGSAFLDLTAEIEHAAASSTDIGPTTFASIPLTIESGKEYHLAFAVEGKTGRTASRPGIMKHDDLTGAVVETGSYVISDTSGGGFPITVTATTSNAGLPRGYILFTTSVRKIVATDYSSAKEVLIPRRSDGDYSIKFGGAVVEAGNALTAALDWDSSGSDATQASIVLDMGATDQITFDAVSVALNAVTPEAGDSFDLLVQLRADNKADVFYQNTSTGQGPEGAADFATISHAVKNAGTRATEHDVTQLVNYVALSGTATVSSIEVGWEPVVMFGDSQWLPSESRLATHLPTAFTHDRISWPAYISGNKMTATTGSSHTAGYLRYKSTTPGEGDLCEMHGVVFCLGSYGVNDVSASIGSTEGNRNKLAALLLTRYAEILEDLMDNDNLPFIIGLPPYSASAADEEEGLAIKLQINPGLEGLALGVRCAFYNPWFAMHSSGVNANGAPTFNAAYTADSGLHYNSAGASVVCANAVQAFEAGIAGAMWSNPARRYARSVGLLTP